MNCRLPHGESLYHVLHTSVRYIKSSPQPELRRAQEQVEAGIGLYAAYHDKDRASWVRLTDTITELARVLHKLLRSSAGQDDVPWRQLFDIQPYVPADAVIRQVFLNAKEGPNGAHRPATTTRSGESTLRVLEELASSKALVGGMNPDRVEGAPLWDAHFLTDTLHGANEVSWMYMEAAGETAVLDHVIALTERPASYRLPPFSHQVQTQNLLPRRRPFTEVSSRVVEPITDRVVAELKAQSENPEPEVQAAAKDRLQRVREAKARHEFFSAFVGDLEGGPEGVANPSYTANQKVDGWELQLDPRTKKFLREAFPERTSVWETDSDLRVVSKEEWSALYGSDHAPVEVTMELK